jgi:glycosyltransferase involved in cell wall biosynthesis
MSNGKPRVSIGMPVHNSEKYLRAALDAILAQTYTDFELIISDNASSDCTAEICKSYAAKDPRIKYFSNAHNLGANPNINKSFELSCGEYFKWAFYDDLVAPDFLAKCVEVLDQNPEVVLCVPKANIIDENGKFLGVHEYRADTTLSKPHLRFRNVVLNSDSGWEIFGLIRANTLSKTALHASYPGSDLVLIAELTLHGRFHILPDALSYPRVHAEQLWMLIPKERDRVVFEDASLEGKIVLPKWGWFFGYLKAIGNAHLGIFEAGHCYITFIRWILKPDHLRALGKDVLLAISKSITRIYSKQSSVHS